MKRLSLLLFFGVLMSQPVLWASTNISQDPNEEVAVEEVDSVTIDSLAIAEEVAMEPMSEAELEEAEPAGFTQELKKRFIEGGPGFMGIVLLCLILGLAIAIKRIIFLNLSTTNTAKLTASVEEALKSGGVEAAKEVCRNTSGPVASIFYQGLDRSSEGIENAEKAVVAYGGVQMGSLKKMYLGFHYLLLKRPCLGLWHCNWYDPSI